MKSTLNLLTALLLTSQVHLHAAASDLSKITSRADLDTVISATTDDALKKTLTDHTAAILAAAEQHPHVEAVIRTIESAPGTFTKTNTTPEALKKAAGGDLALFDTLTMVNTGEMPPEKELQPTQEEIAAFVMSLDSRLKEGRASRMAAGDKPGQLTT